MSLQSSSARKIYRLRSRRAYWVVVAVVLAVVALVPVAGRAWFQQKPGEFPKLPPDAVRMPDANQQNEINAHQQQELHLEAANAERKKELTAETTELLKLATELKAEVDKTNKDTLSLTVIHKADLIEKLAHDVKKKMKLTVGPG
ncbi:MAG TPA: hypothetical protein VMV57_09180 [Terracidiphilus sp.]|nr:hypothetical protein [Terracidiphilus sp.]